MNLAFVLKSGILCNEELESISVKHFASNNEKSFIGGTNINCHHACNCIPTDCHGSNCHQACNCVCSRFELASE